MGAFANDTEKWLAGALAGVFLLSMATAGLLCYSCCAQTHGAIRISLLFQAVVLLSVCGIFALYRRDKLPAAAEVRGRDEIADGVHHNMREVSFLLT